MYAIANSLRPTLWIVAKKAQTADPIDPSQYLKERRGKLSYRELGKRSGISFTYLSELEKGLRPWGSVGIDTLEAIARGLGVSVEEFIRVARGRYIPEDSKQTEKLEKLKPSIRLPLYGSVAAGLRGFEEREEPEQWVRFDSSELPKGVVNPDALFLLTVNGDSMYEEGLPRPIPYGSRVVVEYGAMPIDRDLVIAWITHKGHGEFAAVKQYREGPQESEEKLLRSYKRGGPTFWASEAKVHIVGVVRRVTFDP